MDHPFLNPSGLTDDQLMEKIQKCHRILSQEGAMGHSSVVDSARAALETYQFEWNERMQRRAREDVFKKDEEKGPLEFGVVEDYYHPDEDKEED